MAETSKDGAAVRRLGSRQLGVLVLATLLVVFAVLNLDDVSVDWLVATWQTPLIIVIAVSVLVGAGIGFQIGRRRRPARLKS